MEKQKSFNVARAIELLKKTNQPSDDVKKKTKFDNTLDLFDALIAQEGRCIIYQRIAFAKIINVGEMTFRNYLSKLSANGYKLVQVVVGGKDGEEVLKTQQVGISTAQQTGASTTQQIDKPDETTAEQVVGNTDEVQLPIPQPTLNEGSLPTVKKTGEKKTQPQLRTDVKSIAKPEQPDDAVLKQPVALKV